MKKKISFIWLIMLISCSENDNLIESCPDREDLIYDYIAPEGDRIQIYNDGKAYILDNENCEFAIQFFEPLFFENTYSVTDSGIYFNNQSQNVSPLRNFQEDFEDSQSGFDFLLTDLDQRDRLFTGFTMQSPLAKSVSEYIALQNCILDQSCTFRDNRFDLITSHDSPANKYLKFYSVDPSEDMVTAKSSIVSSVVLFQKGDIFTFEADYKAEGALPHTIADFESTFFEGSIGPRIVIENDRLGIENKFGPKEKFDQVNSDALEFPLDTWVNVKIKIHFDVNNGSYKLWQDDQLVIDINASTMPFDIWVFNRLEVGISATSHETTLCVDNISISDR